jgi:hypothetical protein
MTAAPKSDAVLNGQKLIDLLIDVNNLDQWTDRSFAGALADALILALTGDQLAAFMSALEKAGVTA